MKSGSSASIASAAQVLACPLTSSSYQISRGEYIGTRAPVKHGDHVIVHGEYIWNAQGGLIHFTHHDPQGTHEGGYIQDGGTTYD